MVGFQITCWMLASVFIHPSRPGYKKAFTTNSLTWKPSLADLHPMHSLVPDTYNELLKYRLKKGLKSHHPSSVLAKGRIIPSSEDWSLSIRLSGAAYGFHSEVNSLKEVGEMPYVFLFQLVFQGSVEICSG